MARAGIPEQLALTGLEDAPKPKDSLFFAIFPDPQAVARSSELSRRLCEQHRLRGRPIRPDRLHVTLHPFGIYAGLPHELVSAAKEAAGAVAIPPFDVVFDRVLSFGNGPRNRPLVLCGGDGVAALRSFQQTLVAAMRDVGLRLPAAPVYTPHLTLLYDDRGLAEEAVEPIAWTVREFVLVHSLVGETLHIPLARWPLYG